LAKQGASGQYRACAEKSDAVMRICLILFLACPGAAMAGQTVYRSVDDSGAVTYSSVPVSGAVESRPVELPPGPTEEQKAQARARLERTRQLGDEMAAEREAKRHPGESDQGGEVDTLARRGAAIGAQPTREELAEEARRKAEAIRESVEHTKESVREELARRREERRPLPREPVHIQPVPGPGDIGNGPGPNPVRIQPVPGPGDIGNGPGPNPMRIQPVPSVGSPGVGAPGGARGGRRGRGGG